MKLAAVCIAILVAAVSIAAVRESGAFNQSLPASLPSPKGLTQVAMVTGRSIRMGGWTSRHTIKLGVAPSPGNPDYRLQIQLTTNGAVPSGNVTATEATVASHPTVVERKLADGTYRWWARFYNGKAVSQWIPYSAGPAFGIDTVKPSTPEISSATDPSQTKVYRSGTVQFSWVSSHARSGIAAYWYDFGLSRIVTARPAYTRTTSSSLSQSNLPSGNYTLLLRARDRAGDWSRPARYNIRLDSTPPTVSAVGFTAFSFNPHYSSMTMNYVVTRPSWIRIGIYNQATNQRVRIVNRRSTQNNQLLHYTWRGRDNQGRIVAPGSYTFAVRTTDAYHNTSVKEYSGLSVLNKVIIVSLSQQRLWAYQNHKQLLTSLVTTGNPRLPTPTGTFTILEKRHPFEFISPFPKTAWDYYLPSWVQYAMLFRQGGYFIHDAPWRSVFGPGSNTAAGAPGQATTGTHGCINVPGNIAYDLYQWAPNGTPVVVEN